MSCNEALLTVENASVRYQNAESYALDHVSLTFQRGEFVCILGKTGAGKSTFIRTLNGLQSLTEGEIVYNSRSFQTLDREGLRRQRRSMGMIFQHHQLIPRLTVLQNVYTGLFGSRSTIRNLAGLFNESEKKLARDVIEQVELLPHLNKRVDLLSGGQRQRVGIARALAQSPDIFLGDEPVASLDPGTANRIFQLIHRLHEERNLLTIINVHDVKLAKRYASRIVALKEGRVVFDDRPEALTEEIEDMLYEL
ncbi:phosphonate ABC transporter ATP-binding protein [Pseudalkalibacillus hwajinpoensis]|uniref:phosphonate ABC transporter ATP-binding protein n=1 Tax=Guptibacillus hwajinpoensis TaxID=208199 RepID=UPI001CD24483|nr:phosphonate ABC transporter ATP-binding protein [Pseudalkalibacillus hwajinpoensis]MCA0990320.1 phosphonate ABC transporter ATP-binding protein [Pseudalkalibacillus hwajinpoensis]